jgi:hypothetical protein
MTELAPGIEDVASGPGAGGAAELRRRLVDELRDDLLEKASQLPLRNHASLGCVVTLCRDPNVSARGVAIEAASRAHAPKASTPRSPSPPASRTTSDSA